MTHISILYFSGIKLPYIVFVVKNMKKYFTFEIQIKDDKGINRRFRASNYQSSKLNTVLRKLTASLNYSRLSPLYNATFLSM